MDKRGHLVGDVRTEVHLVEDLEGGVEEVEPVGPVAQVAHPDGGQVPGLDLGVPQPRLPSLSFLGVVKMVVETRYGTRFLSPNENRPDTCGPLRVLREGQEDMSVWDRSWSVLFNS